MVVSAELIKRRTQCIEPIRVGVLLYLSSALLCVASDRIADISVGQGPDERVSLPTQYYLMHTHSCS